MTKIPGTKTHQAYFMSLRYIFTYDFGEGIDDLASLFQIEACSGSDLVYQFIFTNDGRVLFW